MEYKRILTVQDISCLGQCSLTVALPILSALGVETCVLPSAILSTHTAGFTGFTFRDLTEDIPKIQKHWEKENLYFDGVYTGYLGSPTQIEYVKNLTQSRLKDGGVFIVDPAMADNGKLYPLFDENYVEEMKKICFISDILLPNITEACYLSGSAYQTEYDEKYIKDLLEKLARLGAKTVVLTGVSYREGKTGVAVYEQGNYAYYEHKKIAQGCHGTGDVYASAFAGSYMRGKTAFEAAKIAADYTVVCIENTQDDPNHWYGVKFETAIDYLISQIEK